MGLVIPPIMVQYSSKLMRPSWLASRFWMSLSAAFRFPVSCGRTGVSKTWGDRDSTLGRVPEAALTAAALARQAGHREGSPSRARVGDRGGGGVAERPVRSREDRESRSGVPSACGSALSGASCGSHSC